MRIALLVSALLLCGCASSGYRQFYQANVAPEVVASTRVGPAAKEPALEHASGSGDDIAQAYVRRGYAVMGYSAFNSGRREEDDDALEQGEKVGADLVVVVNPKHTGTISTSVPITTPTTATSYATGTATAYWSCPVSVDSLPS